MSNFQHPQKGDGTISIGSTDEPSVTVDAQYNPKELQVDLSVPWQKTNQANQANGEGIHLEFTGAEGRSMSVELLFDGYETGTSIADKVDALVTMASVIVAVWFTSDPLPLPKFTKAMPSVAL